MTIVFDDSDGEPSTKSNRKLREVRIQMQMELETIEKNSKLTFKPDAPHTRYEEAQATVERDTSWHKLSEELRREENGKQKWRDSIMSGLGFIKDNLGHWRHKNTKS